jgi:glycosidase
LPPNVRASTEFGVDRVADRISLAKLGRVDFAFGGERFFHVRKDARDSLGLADALFALRGDVVFADIDAARAVADSLRAKTGAPVGAAQVYAMGLIHEVCHAVVATYRKTVAPAAFDKALEALRAQLDAGLDKTLAAFVRTYPPPSVYRGEQTASQYLGGSSDGVSNREWMLEEILLLWLANQNPAFAPIAPIIRDDDLRAQTAYPALIDAVQAIFADEPRMGPGDQSLVDLLLAPIRHAPNSLTGQLEYMRVHWGLELSKLTAWRRLLSGIDFLREEANWFMKRGHGNEPAPSAPVTFGGDLYEEPERYSPDKDWMPKVVMIAKSTFVWLDQLSKKYKRQVATLADVPDEELDALARRGFTALWLIGVWQRSRASQRIKQMQGNPDALASAYSLYDYVIASELGGHDAYESLRARAWRRGIRLASDMVPNHMGIDSRWVIEHPDWFIQSREPPFPYRFTGADLSDDDRVGIQIEDGYWSRTDAAVVFRRFDKHTGDQRFVYHGNDGTSMPWNDTAQLDYLLPQVREAVIQTILHVARMFPVIRFDAAMTLAKRHYQRLWFPLPGHGGDIPSRARFSMTREEFDRAFPIEFWREVVDRVAQEAPDTLLLAEAFWLMEGYFVRTLGMHRVYNSAFMNMLKREENANFRSSIKNVLEFDPRILERHVNFMNNPDEETAIAQFGKDDKYFGVATLLSTMPGLPMFGHGQVEGFTEKYGMEYRRAMRDEEPDGWLVERHEREIFPLLRRRHLWSGVDQFHLFDMVTPEGHVDEDVIAYSNRAHDERSLVLFHNKYKETRGHVRRSVGFKGGSGNIERRSLGDALGLASGDDRFVVFRDQVTGLEYLRKSDTVRGEGLYVELGAFKYHVFTDFRDVAHTLEEPYADLAREIGGRGVASMDDELVALRFRAIHAPYFEAIAPGSVKYLIAGYDAKTERLTKEAMAAAREKITHVVHGVAYLFGAIDEPDAIAIDLERRLEAIAARDPDDPNANVAVAWLFTEALGEMHRALHADPLEDVVVAWHLDRVILRALRAAGMAESDARRATAIVHLLVRHAPIDPKTILTEILADEDGQRMLGVNEFEGVRWFHKESAEALVDAIEACAIVGDAAVAEMRDAIAKSEYRVDKLENVPTPSSPRLPASP